MTTEQLTNLIKIYYDNPTFLIEYDTLSNAKTSFNSIFTTQLARKQEYIDLYYNTLFDKINNYADLLSVTKEGSTILEKHKGRKESYNKDEFERYNEQSKTSTNSDLKVSQNSDSTDTTTFGKTESQDTHITDTKSRAYFGGNSLVNSESTSKVGDTSNNHNKLTEGGSETKQTTADEQDNYTRTVGDKSDNYVEITKDDEHNYKNKVADALTNYKTITDIADNIFDKDIMDYNDYKSNTSNSINELNNLWKLIEELKKPLFIEKIILKLLSEICYSID